MAVFSPLLSFKIFFFYSLSFPHIIYPLIPDFMQFDCDMPVHRFFVFAFWTLSCLVLSQLSDSVVWCLTLVKFSIIWLHVFLLFLSSPLDIPIMHVVYRLYLAHNSWIFFLIFLTFFLFPFQSFYWHFLKLRDCLPSCVQSELSQGPLLFTYSVLTSFLFYSFLKFPSLCLHCPFVPTWCLCFHLCL